MAKSMAHGIRAFATLALVLALVGCGAMDVPMPSFPQNRAGTEARAPANTIIVPTSRPRLEPDYIPRVEELVGLGEAEAEGYFGAPGLRRVDQDAQIWQYRTDACVLFLFFYPGEDGSPRVSYVTSSGAHNGETSPGDQPCVDAVTRDAVNDAASSSQNPS